jgi:hypothetical protein
MSNVTERELIDEFNVDQINCFEKPLAILSDNIIRNSMYYYILFTELHTSYHNLIYCEHIFDLSGVRFIKTIQAVEDFTNQVIELLHRHGHIILVTDLRYDENHPRFYLMNENHEHFAIVKGYDEVTKKFVLIDEEPNEAFTSSIDGKGYKFIEYLMDADKLRRLACDDNKGREFTYFFSEVTDSNKCEFKYILNTYKEHLVYMLDITEDYYQTFRDNILAFNNNLDKYKGRTSFYPYPEELCDLMAHINALSTQQRLFDLLLVRSKQKEQLTQIFTLIINKCKLVRGLIAKGFFSNDRTFCDNVLNKHLGELKNYEIRLMEYLTGIINEMQYKSVDDRMIIYFSDNEESGYDDIVRKGIRPDNTKAIPNIIFHVDLSEHLNNKAISPALNSGKADLTGGALSYYFSDISKIKEVFESSPFFIELQDSKNDNISCLGQSVKLSNENYSILMIAGCSEWGNFEDNILIKYQDDSVDELTLGFTDWVAEPIYNERILAEGKMLENGVDISPLYTARIFYHIFQINKEKALKNIVLPDCPNMHIFSISLGR